MGRCSRALQYFPPDISHQIPKKKRRREAPFLLRLSTESLAGSRCRLGRIRTDVLIEESQHLGIEIVTLLGVGEAVITHGIVELLVGFPRLVHGGHHLLGVLGYHAMVLSAVGDEYG